MIVLDASAWVDVVAGGSRGSVLESKDITVPPHFDVEVIGSIRALHQRRVLTDDAADRAVDRHLRAPFVRSFEPADARAAWTLREAMSSRDAWYVALAQRLEAVWVTADLRAARVAGRHVRVHVVAD
ncbi:type II toxin-antitoxin system VapC family toxin [Luteipulveratus flavus]|uniref:Ribonuclease VapC n=1 Tax=Luteipulveratus flavus TaxID=3031728 RepID=A0ABT6C6F5_9MICO|nr:PIN domain-containing protein [Luteipulveratus sp. YIM 133296]MDF8264370.1 PIN domain-containing protein [Luteipulveratus sp. YIM 133296]